MVYAGFEQVECESGNIKVAEQRFSIHGLKYVRNIVYAGLKPVRKIFYAKI